VLSFVLAHHAQGCHGVEAAMVSLDDRSERYLLPGTNDCRRSIAGGWQPVASETKFRTKIVRNYYMSLKYALQ
jgi:hypothetical protein